MSHVTKITTAAAALTALALTALAACGATAAEPRRSPTPVTSPTAAAISAPVPVRIQLPAGHNLMPHSPAPDGCPGHITRIYLGSGGVVRFVAYATTCKAENNTRLSNGRHGIYRTVADIPADRRAAAVTVQTPLGEATVFTQPYSEYTNSENHYTEPVAVITLTKPADPAYAALTVMSEKGVLTLEGLTALLRDQLLTP
jgi:hypothetical protein